jgi:hypothetical protein
VPQPWTTRVELFKITCVTCRARLSVRDAALIGKIIGCPKCGMMVQVTAPADDSPRAASATIAAAAAIAAPPPPVEDAFADVPEVAAPAATPTVAHESGSVFDDADMTASDALVEPPPPPPAPPAIATAASRATTYKLAALTVAGAIAGSAVVAAALSWFSDDAPTVAVAPAAKVESKAEQPEAPAPAPAPTEAPEERVAPEASDPEPEALLPIDDAPDDDAIAATPSEVEPLAPAESRPTETAPPVEEPTPLIAEAPPVDAAPEPRLRIDPLDVDPEGLNLSTLYGGPPKDPLAESQLPKEDEPAPSVPDDEPHADEADAAPPAAQTVRRDAHAGVGAPSDAAVLLARKLPAIKFNRTPLCRLLDLAVQVSGLPVSVSAEELRRAAVSAATPATVDAKDATIESLLMDALKPLRLKPVVDGEQIVLKRDGEDKRRAVDYAVDDLANTPAKVDQLGEWIQQLAAPESWQAAGGDATLAIDGGKLRVDAAESVQYEVLFVLERYRVTRGLPTRTKYPAALFAAGAFHASVADRLAAPAVFTFSHYTPLREIFRYWQEELDVAVLVDWPALADARLWPGARIACSAADKSWAEAMDSVLEPLGLGWRAVGRNTIEITTLTKIREESLLEVYRVAADASVDAGELVARVESLAGDDANQKPTRAVYYDPESRVLLVRQPAAAHRKLIAEMRDLLAAPATAAAQ